MAPFRSLGMVLLTGIAGLGCQKDSVSRADSVALPGVPAWFPTPESPADNAHTHERWQLGKDFFYDKALSANYTVSCASCHKPHFSFSDSLAFSPGDMGAKGESNAPGLANVVYHPYFNRDGGTLSLEMQALVPIHAENELNMNILDLADRLRSIPRYAEASLAAYGRELDPFVITRALGVFQRSFISGNSAYDKFEYEGHLGALNAAERRGKDLFFSARTDCSSCHSDFNFTNYAFENNGLYETYEALGRMKLTGQESDRAKFKMPSLRNVAVTGPYMHDGSLPDLESVVAHYVSGGANHPNKNPLIRPLDLSNDEQADLVAFLRSLTDYDFLTNPVFRP